MTRFVLWLSSGFIFILKKLSGVNITISGEVPAGPVLFLANHFTRFETFVVPYVLFSKYRCIARSLADETLFVGWLGKYMRLAGSISNKNEARDCIIVDDFLTAKADWIIYPEGHMVKNKRISFENNAFCIHTALREGPVHTGAAVLALKAQIVRQRAALLQDEERVKRFCATHHITKEAMESSGDLQIVPLSITYFPIRPGKNRLLLWLDRYLNLRGTRFFEELEIEINLLMDANMHLHFAKPILLKKYIKQYLHKHPGNLEDEGYADELIDTMRSSLTNTIMEKVYGNLQINFDHIFILSLVTMPTTKVCPSYLKTLIYKNARQLRNIKGLNLHPELKDELFKLILDKEYAPFVSAVKLAQMQQIFYIDSEGDYLFDKNLLQKHYDFNKIRVKNTLQVILNEIYWHKEIVAVAKKNSHFTERALREDNFLHLQRREWVLYEEEYRHYHDRAPSHDSVGAPRIYFDAKNKTGLVFSHGYMAAPAEADEMAAYLFSKGINVYLLRLRGHGSDPKALLHVSADDWELDFERAFTAMRQVCEKVYIGGFSTGGLLALLHAARYDVEGVIAINSALKLNDLKVSYVVPTLHAFNEMINYLHLKGIKEWVENHSENPAINYPRHPLASIAMMERVMTRTEKAVENITDPILIIQGEQDPVVNPLSAELIYKSVDTSCKKLLLLPRKNHTIIRGEGAEEVFEAIFTFMTVDSCLQA